MLTYVLDVRDLSDVRFVLAPMNETSLSLFHLNTTHDSSAHLQRWRSNAQAQRDRYDHRLVSALVAPSGNAIPDFLTPMPPLGDSRPSLDEGLTAIAATDPALIHAQLDELREGGDPSPALARLLDDPERAGPRIAGALERYRAELAAALVNGTAGPAELERLALVADWPVPERLSVVVLPAEAHPAVLSRAAAARAVAARLAEAAGAVHGYARAPLRAAHLPAQARAAGRRAATARDPDGRRGAGRRAGGRRAGPSRRRRAARRRPPASTPSRAGCGPPG